MAIFIVLGASGHVGSAATTALLEAGQPVTAVLHDPAKAADWEARGAKTAVVDVRDSDALREVFKTGQRAFLLNPNADIATDTDQEEHATVRGIVKALDGSGLDKVVAESTLGAQPGERCGDLNVLYDFEQALAAQPIPAAVQRAAYYFSNWDMQLEEAKGGVLTTMLPADLKIPMVAPEDLGRAAARRLREPAHDEHVSEVEGPERYSPRDVAEAFAEALGRPVEVVVTPRDQWVEAYRKQGFSEAAAQSYARMTAASVDSGFERPKSPERGQVTLKTYVRALVDRTSGMSASQSQS
ncbi:NmrA family NAD(P)-binding protein [Caulobacter sp. LARHSG274]